MKCVSLWDTLCLWLRPINSSHWSGFAVNWDQKESDQFITELFLQWHLLCTYICFYTKFPSALVEGKSKISQPIRMSIFVDRSAQNTNLVQNLLQMDVNHKAVSSQVSSNSVQWLQRRTQKSKKFSQSEIRTVFFADRLARKKHKLGGRRWVLASCQVSSNSNQQLQRRRRKCPSKSETRVDIFVDESARKKRKLRGHWVLTFLYLFTNSKILISGFWEDVKMWKVNGRRTSHVRSQ